MNQQLAAWLVPVREIAAAASAAILDIYASAFSVTSKQDRSPVTAADRVAHRIIVAGLQQLTPNLPILSEEGAAIPFRERQTWQRYWLVDPLDGTKEFIERNGQFTVNIALIDQQVPVLGVVHIPVTGRCYFAAQGCGAFRIDAGQAPQAIHVAQLQAGVPVRVVGSKSHGGAALQQFVAALGAHQLVTAGSSLKFCQIAEGSADVYPRLGPTSEWDTAAAQALVEVAGGAVIAADTGTALRYNQRESLLNPHFIAYGDARGEWQRYVPAS